MSDIVERLRDYPGDAPKESYHDLVYEAADEIKRLRASVNTLADECEAAIDQEYISREKYPDTMRRYKRVMDYIRRLRDVAGPPVKETEE